MTSGHCEVRLRRHYNALPAEVWGALTEPDSLTRWLARPLDVELVAGGSFVLELPGGGGQIDARVRTVQAGRVLELDWGHADEARSVVRFELHTDGDGTLLTLDHRRIDEPVGMAYISRWTNALGRLDRELAP